MIRKPGRIRAARLAVAPPRPVAVIATARGRRGASSAAARRRDAADRHVAEHSERRTSRSPTARAAPPRNTGSVSLIDVTDPRNPSVLLRRLHETGVGHHPIRYHHEAQLLDGDRNVMLVKDEDLPDGCGGAGGVTAVRLSNLRSATELSEWFVPQDTPAPVCSVHVLSSEGDRVYLGSYDAGLQVVDYADPYEPGRVAQYIAEGSPRGGRRSTRDTCTSGT